MANQEMNIEKKEITKKPPIVIELSKELIKKNGSPIIITGSEHIIEVVEDDKIEINLKDPVIQLEKLKTVSSSKNVFYDIKGMENMTYDNINEKWIHDQVYKTMQWCDQNRFVAKKLIRDEWVQAGTKGLGTWSFPKEEDGKLICESILNEGISLSCNQPIKLFNKHSNIYTNKFKKHHILAHKNDLNLDITYVGLSKCSYNESIKKNTRYRGNMFVEYNFEIIEEPVIKKVTLRNNKDIKILSGKAKLTPVFDVVDEITRTLVIVPK
jgi:hypothetical protein